MGLILLFFLVCYVVYKADVSKSKRSNLNNLEDIFFWNALDKSTQQRDNSTYAGSRQWEHDHRNDFWFQSSKNFSYNSVAIRCNLLEIITRKKYFDTKQIYRF